MAKLYDIELKGTSSELKGKHTVYFDAGSTINFIDGKAKVTKTVKDKLMAFIVETEEVIEEVGE